ncbi:MAG TPA: DUF1326 domain-containing protein [Terriglobales bacterium]|nr:DUF1326 domain-containing protein [Terriglobales bacterium]
MKSRLLAMITVSLLVLASSAFAADQISGDYIETRSADVWTGPCFANGEVGLDGQEAILAWHVQRGQWDGVNLAGHSVVAVVRANATLGDPYGDPYPAKAVLIVDDEAAPQQQAALSSFARHMGGKLLANVSRVVVAPVDFAVLRDHGHHGAAFLRAGSFVTVQTRGLNDKDHFCGNESTYYPPLTETAHAMPVVAMTDSYQGHDLGESWNIHDKRSAFVGTFAR